MTTSIAENPKAISVRIETLRFYVVLNDGREIGIPYTWFPRLAAATPAERTNWRLIGKGTGIHWEAVDEDLSVHALLYKGSEYRWVVRAGDFESFAGSEGMGGLTAQLTTGGLTNLRKAGYVIFPSYSFCLLHSTISTKSAIT